eukprot:CAMPEP_0175989654 /NCGR_PEP_ID=MMETSP0108-20121206/51881_1 /TAXON_ID=195067 ORGANISM="Goniomonas pacifica, Strain CCMP1869" /NCGR_SAMPLE_ID=MMETSP0108 /ASSEMBLY_ACC=CAM_ASM_000204 /LENGTH=128 /DNA_ID=CAMNT_0017321059 /DNA_START=388 /DNA_END=774 /DNA_ORIENTATION=+
MNCAKSSRPECIASEILNALLISGFSPPQTLNIASRDTVGVPAARRRKVSATPRDAAAAAVSTGEVCGAVASISSSNSSDRKLPLTGDEGCTPASNSGHSRRPVTILGVTRRSGPTINMAPALSSRPP